MFLRSSKEEMCSSSPLPICPTEDAPDPRGNKDAVKHYKRMMAGFDCKSASEMDGGFSQG